MYYLLIIVAVCSAIIVSMQRDVENKRFKKFITRWASRQNLKIIDIAPRWFGFGHIFRDYRSRWYHHYKVRLETKDECEHQAWIVCKRSQEGRPTGDVHFEYINEQP